MNIIFNALFCLINRDYNINLIEFKFNALIINVYLINIM